MPDKTIHHTNPILDRTDNLDGAAGMATAVLDGIAMLMRNASCNDDDMTLTRSEAWGLSLTIEWASNSLREAAEREDRKARRPKSVGGAS